MNAQTLSSIDFSNPEKTDSISLILSDRKIDIPLSLIQEFIKIFKDYEKEQKVSFSQEMRKYFQLINPLSLDDAWKIAEMISDKSFCGEIFSNSWFACDDREIREYEKFLENIRKSDEEKKEWWTQFIKTSILSKMSPTVIEKLSAFVSEQTKKFLSIYEV